MSDQLVAHNTYKRQTSMPPEGFKTTISAGERPQTYVLENAATGTGRHNMLLNIRGKFNK